MARRAGWRALHVMQRGGSTAVVLPAILAGILVADPLVGTGAAKAARPPQGAAATAILVGVVLPVNVKPGEVGSGSLVTDPDRYEDVPALRVIPLRLPLQAGASAHATLEDLSVVLDGYSQPADEALTFTVRDGATSLPIVIRRRSDPATLAAGEAPIEPSHGGGASPGRPDNTPAPSGYTTPPVCVAGGVQKIEGPLSGNSHETSIDVDGLPAQVVAETPRAVYWRLPDQASAGPHQLRLRQGRTEVSFQVCVLSLTMHANQSTLLRGQSTEFQATVSGPEQLPAATWDRAGVPSDLVNVPKLGQIASAFRVPKPGEQGKILFRIDNASRATVSIRPSHGETVVETLGRSDFLAGPHTFSGTIQSKVSGPFTIDGLVVAFFEPIPGHVTTAPVYTGPGPKPCDLLAGAIVHVEGNPQGGSGGLWLVPVKVTTPAGSRLIKIFINAERKPALKFCDWIRITTCHADATGVPYVDGYEPAEDPAKAPPAPPKPPEAPKPPEVSKPPVGGATEPSKCKDGDERNESEHETREFEFVDENSQITIQFYTDIDGALGAAKNMSQFWKAGAVVLKTLGKAVPGGGIVGVLTKYLDEGGSILDAVAVSILAKRARVVTIQIDVTTTIARVEWWTVEVCRGGTWVREKRCRVLPPRRGAYKNADTIRFADQLRWDIIADASKQQEFDPGKVDAWAKAFIKEQMALLAQNEADYKEFAKGCQ